ncbi:MAG: NUDIX domain-containing protein [Geminicoccaceae bacterium]
MSQADDGPPTLGRAPGDVELLDDTTIAEGFWRFRRLRLRHRLFDGTMGPAITRERFQRASASVVLPYDAERERVILIEQFRIGAVDDPISPWLLEPVAGMVEPGEAPEDVARREALEEAGCTIGQLVPCAAYYPSPGGLAEYLHCFIGSAVIADEGGVHGLDHEGENIRAHAVSTEVAWRWLDEGRVRTSPGIICLQYLKLHHAQLRARFTA